MIRFSVFALCLSSSLSAVSAEERTFFTSSRLFLGTETGRSACVRIGDIDGDKNLDVVVANGRHWPQQNFSVADLDGDGNLDWITGNIGQANVVYLGDGSGGVRETLSFGRTDGQTYALAIADMDNDSQPDIIVGNAAQANAVFFNRGGGKSFFEVRFGDPSQMTYNLAVGDLNQDGYTDIAVANSDSQNQVFLNRSKR